MKVNSGKFNCYLFYILILTELIFVLYIGSRKYENISFDKDPIFSFNDNWTYIDDSGNISMITLPVKLDAGGDNTVKISRLLPADTRCMTSLCLYTAHQSIRAYLDDTQIYSYWGNEKNSNFDMASAKMWNIITLPEGAGGKTLTLEIMSCYDDYAGVINEINFGTGTSLIVHIIKTYGLNLLISFIVLFIGLCLIVVYILLKKALQTNKSVLYLGCFSVFVSIWMIMGSKMAQFVMDNPFVSSSLTYLSFMTIPIPILFYIVKLENYRFKKFIINLNYIFFGYTFIMLLLRLLNIFDFHEGLFLLQVLMLIIFSAIISTLCIELFKYKNKDILLTTISLGSLIFFALIEWLFYYLKADITTGTFIQFGFLIFLAILSWESIHKAVDIVKLSESAEYYENLATRDFMTKCKNRAAYSKELDNISLDQEIAIVMADINNMKYINDTFGHLAGDDVIVKCSRSLLKILGNDEKCYRIGGDEFVCIEYNQSKDDIEKKIASFMEECAKMNENCAYIYEVSIGYAFYDGSIDKNIYDTVIRADKNMYQYKMNLQANSLVMNKSGNIG